MPIPSFPTLLLLSVGQKLTFYSNTDVNEFSSHGIKTESNKENNSRKAIHVVAGCWPVSQHNTGSNYNCIRFYYNVLLRSSNAMQGSASGSCYESAATDSLGNSLGNSQGLDEELHQGGLDEELYKFRTVSMCFVTDSQCQIISLFCHSFTAFQPRSPIILMTAQPLQHTSDNIPTTLIVSAALQHFTNYFPQRHHYQRSMRNSSINDR